MVARELDPSDAPEGCKAVPFTTCTACHFIDEPNCETLSHPCTNYARTDGNSVMFVPLRAEELLEKVKGKFNNKSFPKFMKGIPGEVDLEGNIPGYDGVVCFISRRKGFAISGKDRKKGMQSSWVECDNPYLWEPYHGEIKLKFTEPD